MKRKSVYANMKAHDLARITRERGLEKPNVITLSEWADFLEADDAKREKQSRKADAAKDITDEEAATLPDAETEALDGDAQDTPDIDTVEKTTKRTKGKG